MGSVRELVSRCMVKECLQACTYVTQTYNTMQREREREREREKHRRGATPVGLHNYHVYHREELNVLVSYFLDM